VLASIILCFATDNDYPVVSLDVSQATPQIRSLTKPLFKSSSDQACCLR